MFQQFYAKYNALWVVATLFLLYYVTFIEAVHLRSITHNSNNKTVVEKKCSRKLPDGTPYERPCINPNDKIQEGHPVPVTDSEVPDLLQHTTENPGKAVVQVNKSTRSSITPSPAESVIEEIVNPEEKFTSNSRFNIRTGGIAALTCISIAVIFYVGIMVWKQIIMSGYQNREILLNDEDIGDINDEDMRHFELKFLDKEGRVIESTNGR